MNTLPPVAAVHSRLVQLSMANKLRYPVILFTAALLFLACTSNEPVRAESFQAPFCEGCPDNKFLYSNRLIPYEKFKELDRVVHDHASFFRRFIRYYQGDIPHSLVSPAQDIDTLDFYEVFRADHPKLSQIKTTAMIMLALGDYFIHTGDPPKAANIYFLVFKCGMDLELGFGGLQNFLSHLIAIAIQRNALRRLVSLYASGALNRSLEKTFLNRIDRLLKMRIGMKKIVGIERKHISKLIF